MESAKQKGCKMKHMMLGMGALAIGNALGFVIMRKRNCPRRLIDLLISSMVPSLILLTFSLYHTQWPVICWCNYLLLIFLIWPVIISLMMKNCVLVDAEILRDRIREEVSEIDCSTEEFVKKVQRAVYSLVKHGGGRYVKYSFLTTPLLDLLKRILKRKNPLTVDRTRRAVFALIEDAIHDPREMEWNGFRWVHKSWRVQPQMPQVKSIETIALKTQNRKEVK